MGMRLDSQGPRF